ncbi:MAG: hypothetical protein GX384_05330 [Clostridiaceae bacterium]|jgi:hypothetical protein|nr:hypothetical protein [Bacillota bacterium]NLI38755.1 hypothetical protein [Clostridiaceae bacterium]
MKLKGKLITTFLVILLIFSTFISLLMTGGMRQSYEVQLQENTVEMSRMGLSFLDSKYPGP